MIRCDHCRRLLGARIHRYWQMRFCSPVCADAYRDRLDDATQVKIRLLDGPAKSGWSTDRWSALSRKWHNDLRQHLPGLSAR